MRAEDVTRELRTMGDPKAAEGLSRFGIKGSKVYGVSLPKLRALARKAGKSHRLAMDLWETGIHEARLIAGMVDDPLHVTEQQMEAWVKDFDSWDIVDQSCGNLFDKTPFAVKKAFEWSTRVKEYEKRAAFALMAELAVHEKTALDETFARFLPVIIRESGDERNFVKKAVNWALRQIGKRNIALNKAAIEAAEQIRCLDSRSAKWIASDALRELRSEPVQKKLKAHSVARHK